MDGLPGDESRREPGTAQRLLDQLPPAAGDVRDLLERLPLIVYIDAPIRRSPNLYVSPQTTNDARLHAGGMGARAPTSSSNDPAPGRPRARDRADGRA